MGCSSSKLDGLPAVALCRDRCKSMEETLRRSCALSEAHTTYLLSLTTIGPTLHRFFDQAVESPVDTDSEYSSSAHSVTSLDSDPPPKFDSDGEEDEGTHCLQKHEPQFPDHESDSYSRSYVSGTVTPPPPLPPSNYGWDFINFFESYEYLYTTTNAKDLKDKETSLYSEEDKPIKKKVLKSRNKEKKPKMSKKKKKENPKASLNSSEVTKQLQEMFKKASEAGENVSKMATMDSKLVEDFGTSFGYLSSTLKKLYLWEKKLYQEVKAEEKLRTSYMKNYKQLKRLEQKSTDLTKLEATRSSIQCLSTRMRVSIHKINNICITINKLRDEELWSQMKELIHRLSEMWSSMLECHNRQYRMIVEAKKLDKMVIKEKLDISQLEIAMALKLELRNWSQSLSKLLEAHVKYVNALNSWLMRCLKQEPQEPTPDLSEEPPLFGVVNSWSQALERSDRGKELTNAVNTILSHINRQVEKQRMELEEERNVNGLLKDIEKKKLGMLEKMKTTMPSLELTESSNLKSNMEQIFKSMEKLSRNSKQAYEKLDLLCT